MKNTQSINLLDFLNDLKTNLYLDRWLLIFLLGVPIGLSLLLCYFEIGAIDAKITSWPEALYVTWITLMTIGYGDLTPVTLGGRIIACIDAVFGVVMFGLVVYHFTKAREPHSINPKNLH